jgi:hypothetical protein
MEMNDIYFGLVCLASVLVLAVILNYFMDFIDKDGKDE